MDLHTFPITSEPEVAKLQNMAQSVSLKDTRTFKNDVCSKPRALATNSTGIFLFCSQITFLYSALSESEKKLRDNEICCGFKYQVNISFQVCILQTMKQKICDKFENLILLHAVFYEDSGLETGSCHRTQELGPFKTKQILTYSFHDLEYTL